METTLDVTAAQQRVREGAAFLDGAYPGWREHVDVNTLDMTDDTRCVLGQLARSWPGHTFAWNPGYGDVIEFLGWSDSLASEYGFIVHTGELAGYDHLATARLAPLWEWEITNGTPTGL